MKTVKKTMILAFLFPILMTVLAVSAVYTANASSGKMTITAIDLRGGNSGEATMISAEDGTPLLVDSGDNANRAVFDWLDSNGYGRKRFNTLVTHWHDDHAGNTAEIIRKYNVGTVYLPATDYLDIRKTDYYNYEKSYATDTLRAAKARGTRVVYLKKGAVIKVGTGVSGEVLYINGSPITESGGGIEHINNQSAVIMFTGGGSRFLTAGDLSYKGEERVLKSGVSLKADIFKMSHHGYDTSCSWGFINAVNPTYAWYTSNSVSTEKFTSSATRAASNRMSSIANTFSTRYNGTIRFECSNGNIRVSAETDQQKDGQRQICDIYLQQRMRSAYEPKDREHQPVSQQTAQGIKERGSVLGILGGPGRRQISRQRKYKGVSYFCGKERQNLLL